MTSQTDRREFIRQCAQLGMTTCALIACGRNLFSEETGTSGQVEIPDPKKLTYCGYQCPPDCAMLRATRENSLEQKKKAFESWQIGQRYGVTFDQDRVICWGCKAEDKPEGIVIQKCTVRPCAMKRNLDSCIQCEDLGKCDKELWSRFPEFKKQVEKMQSAYMAALKNE